MDILGSVGISILALVVTLGILVTFHEFGHFWVARRCGVKVERFSVGFGKPLWKRQVGETEYVIAALPLGGYVKMLGEQDGELSAEERPRAFSSQPLYKRSAIVAAGPIANFLLAIVIYWVMFQAGVSGLAPVVGTVVPESPAAEAGFRHGDEIVAVDGKTTRSWQEVHYAMLERLGESGDLSFSVQAQDSSATRALHIPLQNWLVGQGQPDPLNALGLSQWMPDFPARLGEVLPDGRAAAAGLQAGDEVIAVNGEALRGWRHWVDLVRANPDSPLAVELRRSNDRLQVEVVPAARQEGDQRIGYIGAAPEVPETLPAFPEEMNRSLSYGPLAALPQALDETWSNLVFILDSLKKMVIGLISVENLGGPITIAQVAGQTASIGFEYYLGFLAMLSISLGVLNLLPIPVLDGGHLFYHLIEAVTRRPVPDKVQEWGLQLGILLVVGITILAFYNDVNRLF